MKRKILIIDDEHDIVELLKAVLRTKGYDIIVSYDGQDGWALLLQHKPDLAIVDAQCTLTGIRSPDGKEAPAFKPHLVLVMSKREGGWRILCGRPYTFASRPGMTS